MEQLSLLGSGVGLSVLVVVIGYLLRQNAQDRKDCREAVEALERRYADEVEARRDIQKRIDVERELRREAQSKAWQQTWELTSLRAELERRQKAGADDGPD